jgi:hypothetical protein
MLKDNGTNHANHFINFKFVFYALITQIWYKIVYFITMSFRKSYDNE